jgi:hypothetical protein
MTRLVHARAITRFFIASRVRYLERRAPRAGSECYRALHPPESAGYCALADRNAGDRRVAGGRGLEDRQLARRWSMMLR